MASRIIVRKAVGDVLDLAESEEYFNWLYGNILLFQKVFGKRFKQFRP